MVASNSGLHTPVSRETDVAGSAASSLPRTRICTRQDRCPIPRDSSFTRLARRLCVRWSPCRNPRVVVEDKRIRITSKMRVE